jgi:hypothetical protein
LGAVSVLQDAPLSSEKLRILESVGVAVFGENVRQPLESLGILNAEVVKSRSVRQHLLERDEPAGFSTGSCRSISASSRLKIAVFAPSPSAKDRIARASSFHRRRNSGRAICLP